MRFLTESSGRRSGSAPWDTASRLGRHVLLTASLTIFACSAAQAPEIVSVDRETRVEGRGPGGTPTDLAAAEFAARAATGDSAASSAAVASTSFREESKLRLLQVRRIGNEDATRMVLQLSRTPSNVQSFPLADPPRCVIDAHGPMPGGTAQSTLDIDDPLAPRLRLGLYSDHLRMVLERAGTSTAPCRVETRGSAVIVSIGELPGQVDASREAVAWTATALPSGASAHAASALAAAAGLPPPASAAPPAAVAANSSASRPAAPPRAAAPSRSRSPQFASPSSATLDSARSGAPLPPPGFAASGPRYTGRRISLEFKDADLLNVLRIIADVAQKNIVATDDVKGRVTIVLREVPWDQALDIVLKSTGLEKVEVDDVITVSTAKRLEDERKTRLAAQQAGVELEPLRTEYLKVNYVKAGDLQHILQGDPRGGGDQGGSSRGLLSSRGTVQVNNQLNTLIVRDVADGIMNARQMVKELDVQTPQVLIESSIFEANTNLDRDLGVQWGYRYVASPETGNPTGRNFPGRVVFGGGGAGSAGSGGTDGTGGTGANALPIMVDFPAPGVGPGAGSTLGLLLGSLSGSSTLDVRLTALEQAGKGKVISRPKVITLNNTEAQIQSLEILRVRLPSTGTVINTGQGGSAGGSAVATEKIETGITLRVTPQISSDGYVLLQIFVKSSIPARTRTDDIPNEIAREATSRVLVRQGETVVIGGVYRQVADSAESGVPYLRSIPVLGWAFKNQTRKDERQELVVFITPRLVWGTESMVEGAPTARELWDRRPRSSGDVVPEGGAGQVLPASPGAS